MFDCPSCSGPLVRGRNDLGLYWGCPHCGGRAVGIPLLRQVLNREFLNELWTAARSERGIPRRPCPSCLQPMTDVPIAWRDYAQWLDVCPRCQWVWFDPHEYEGLPFLLPNDPRTTKEAREALASDPRLSPKAREALAIEKAKRVPEPGRGFGDGGPPQEWWELIPAFLGLPVEENNPVAHKPVTTRALVGVIVAVSFFAFFSLRSAIETFGLVPAHAFRYGGLTFLTSFFLHGGLLHLLGNMYFLWIFGDNVEDVLGRRRFLLLVLLSTVAGDLLHVVGDPRSLMPCVGASGGISGVIIFYAFQFPHARLGMYWQWWFTFRRIVMPAWGYVAFWVLLQFIGAGAQMAGVTSVSALAHLGGAGVGFVFWLVTRVR